jgi:hypothetical protein
LGLRSSARELIEPALWLNSDVRRWVTSIGPRELAYWLARGVDWLEAWRVSTSSDRPSELWDWSDLEGITAVQAGRWCDAGMAPAELRRLFQDRVLEADADPMELRRAGVPLTYEGALRWGGLTAEQIYDAIDRGFEDASTYEPFAGSAIRADEVEELREAGIERWLGQGLTVDEAAMWMSGGFAPSTAKRWAKLLATPAEVRAWQELGVGNPSQVRAWIRAGFDVESVGEWLRHGFDPEEAGEWRLAGADASTAARRAAAGLRPPPRDDGQ